MEIIGLGYNCSIASTLRRLGLMREKNVFDNMATRSLEKLSLFLATQGSEKWFLPKNVEWFDHKSTEEWLGGLNIAKLSCHAIVDTKWDIMSGHDVSLKVNREEALQLFVDRKKSLMNNFFQLMKHPDKIIMVRSNLPETRLEEVILLHDVIADLREDRPFSVCVFQDAPFAEKNYGIQTLELYRTKAPSYRATYKTWNYPPEWRIAFQAFSMRHNLRSRILL
jgi:hypothetical protein